MTGFGRHVFACAHAMQIRWLPKVMGFGLWLWLASLAVMVAGMTQTRLAELREQTGAMFYHGWDNYMRHAFPEDELRPLSCMPLARDPTNSNTGLNDVLGNYSLTVIDSLSTLAILAGSTEPGQHTGPRALADFQRGVEELVRHYGDGTPGPSGQGIRARGFDLDSKVQVFETVIRGVGGLLSAHLFAIGELPIAGYDAGVGRAETSTERSHYDDDYDEPVYASTIPIDWPGGFRYDGQLLRLALDLAERILPAFFTKTGLPYPRVNLRHGIPFYPDSPINVHNADYSKQQPSEVTETCSAGAGSLVLEFTVLSRLTGDSRFEQAAKRAFWAIWDRRSNIGLVGNGIDAEDGHWIGVGTGIGAGVDSFFEYAFKSHVLLSGDHEQPPANSSTWKRPRHGHLPSTAAKVLSPQHKRTRLDPDAMHPPLSPHRNSADAFLDVWHEAHAAIKRHLYTDAVHPHYINGHVTTGSPVALWIDSLGAFYPGLLTLAGELDEAADVHLVYTALWTRYAALPERWSVRDSSVESGLGWWPGRPEFIESTYFLYHATADPWYLHVGEMVLADIKRRCWAPCGWAGLEDVRTGEKSDRMESFFLGETAKYLHLLFDPDHPLNKLDAAFVFNTEGHPLIIPKDLRGTPMDKRVASDWHPPVFIEERRMKHRRLQRRHLSVANTCPAPASPLPLTVSETAARSDLFHAASLVGLYNTLNVHEPIEALSAKPESHTTPARIRPRTNHTMFPWTLPSDLMPAAGTCSKIISHPLVRLEFPATWGAGRAHESPLLTGASGFLLRASKLIRAGELGVEVLDAAELKLTLGLIDGEDDGGPGAYWRVTAVANAPLGRDELVYINADLLAGSSDVLFGLVEDDVTAELVLIFEELVDDRNASAITECSRTSEDLCLDEVHGKSSPSHYRSLLQSLVKAVTSAFDAEPTACDAGVTGREKRHDFLPSRARDLVRLEAVLPTGAGAVVPLLTQHAPAATAPHLSQSLLLAGLVAPMPQLQWTTFFFGGDACRGELPSNATQHHVVVVRRGGCTFSEKIGNIPDFEPGPDKLQLVLVVDETGREDWEEEHGDDYARRHHDDDDDGDYDDDYAEKNLERPLLDKQMSPSGQRREHPVAMVLVRAGPGAYERFAKVKSAGMRRRYWVESQGLKVSNVRIL